VFEELQDLLVGTSKVSARRPPEDTPVEGTPVVGMWRILLVWCHKQSFQMGSTPVLASEAFVPR